MRSKNVLQLFIYILSIVVIVSTSVGIYFLSANILNQGTHLNPSNTKVEDEKISLKEKVSTLDMRLKIPNIKVNSAIESIGLTSQGELDVPKELTNTGWFNLSAPPGNKGTSVIDGHFGWKNDVQAVFDNLHTLLKGDKVYIVDENNIIITFIVREIKTYDISDDVSGVFASNDDKSHLNLITCYGEWNKTEQGYPQRLVIFTDREN
ncbi:MAG: class F sortase [Candidatus Doudnabacteria bacterium]